MALALYRKYRPRTFAEVIGQDHVTEPLIQALSNGRLNHAYLFSGPRGCGKTSSARILARSLNCEKGPTPTPCGECDSCRALAPDGPGSIDVIEIDAASHGGVDDARELRERAFFAPAISRYKIYIIDEAHMVSSAGFNALLKLVEEPPDYVKFVFATTEPEKVLGTIKSRTHHYPFRLIPPGVLRPYLEFLASSEGISVEPQVFPLVVRAGGGSARDALSVLDQLIAGSGHEGVTYSRAVALLGVTDVALIDEMVDALVTGDGGTAFATIDRVAEAGHDCRRFAGDLLQRLRDLIILRRVPEAPERGLLDAPEDELARMRAQAGRLGDATLSRCADIVHEGLVEMRGATSPRLLLELLVARMLLPAADDSVAAVLQRVERLESGVAVPVAVSGVDTTPAFPAARGGARGGPAHPGGDTDPAGSGSRRPATSRPTTAASPDSVASGGMRTTTAAGLDSIASGGPPHVTAAGTDSIEVAARPVPSPARSPETAPVTSVAPITPASTVDGGVDAASVPWDEIVRQVGQISKKAAAFAREAMVREIEGDTLVLVFKHKIHADGVSSDPAPLLAAVNQVIGGAWQVRCEIGGDQRTVPAASSTASARSANASAAGTTPADPAARASSTTGGSTTGGTATTIPARGATSRSATSRSATSRGTTSRGSTIQGATAQGATARGATTQAAAGARAGGGRAGGAPSTAGGAGGTRAGGATARSPEPEEEWPTTARIGGGAYDDEPPPTDEDVPYDPEFDGSPARPMHEGFDPGDEPDPDTDSLAMKQTSEEQALESLKQSFNVEKIAEKGS